MCRRVPEGLEVTIVFSVSIGSSFFHQRLAVVIRLGSIVSGSLGEVVGWHATLTAYSHPGISEESPAHAWQGRKV